MKGTLKKKVIDQDKKYTREDESVSKPIFWVCSLCVKSMNRPEKAAAVCHPHLP